MPRARLATEDGATTEWASAAVPRYQRRTARVDEAILGVYLSGGNTRRLKGALAPLLRGGPLGKDAVSRLVGRLAADFETWRQRPLGTEDIRYLFGDGWYPCVRIGKRRERVPILVTLGVRAGGERVVLDLRLVGQESAAGWRDAIDTLVARGLRAPVLAVVDGNPGLHTALRTQWPALPIQRCTVHKLRNLQAKAPVRMREEIAEDYRRMIYGETREEAEDELFTFLRFPASQWKALRTTNALERINEEFRRRTKTQGLLPTEDAVLLLLFGLLRSGHITLRRLDGWQEIPSSVPIASKAA